MGNKGTGAKVVVGIIAFLILVAAIGYLYSISGYAQTCYSGGAPPFCAEAGANYFSGYPAISGSSSLSFTSSPVYMTMISENASNILDYELSQNVNINGNGQTASITIYQPANGTTDNYGSSPLSAQVALALSLNQQEYNTLLNAGGGGKIDGLYQNGTYVATPVGGQQGSAPTQLVTALTNEITSLGGSSYSSTTTTTQTTTIASGGGGGGGGSSGTPTTTVKPSNTLTPTTTIPASTPSSGIIGAIQSFFAGIEQWFASLFNL